MVAKPGRRKDIIAFLQCDDSLPILVQGQGKIFREIARDEDVGVEAQGLGPDGLEQRLGHQGRDVEGLSVGFEGVSEFGEDAWEEIRTGGWGEDVH